MTKIEDLRRNFKSFRVLGINLRSCRLRLTLGRYPLCIHIIGTESLTPVRPPSSIFEQCEPWTEPQLSLSWTLVLLCSNSLKFQPLVVFDIQYFFMSYISYIFWWAGVCWPRPLLMSPIFLFLRNVLIRTQRAAVASRRPINLATHLPSTSIKKQKKRELNSEPEFVNV